MAGDIGFDPLQISDLVPLQWAREVRARPTRETIITGSRLAPERPLCGML